MAAGLAGGPCSQISEYDLTLYVRSKNIEVIGTPDFLQSPSDSARQKIISLLKMAFGYSGINLQTLLEGSIICQQM